MADLPVGAYRGGSLDCQLIYDMDDLPIGYTQRGKDVYFPRTNIDSGTGKVTGLVGPDGSVISFSGATPTTFIGQRVLYQPTSSADHGAVSGAGAVTAYKVQDGVPVVSVTAASGVNTTLNFSAFTGRLIAEGKASFSFYVPDMVKLGSLTLYLGDNGSFTNSFSCSLSNSSAFPVSGWYTIVVDPISTGAWSTLTETSQRKWAVATGTPDFATTLFTNAKVMISTASGVPCEVMFAECAIGKDNSKGTITFVMDDGGSTQYQRAMPILERYGMRASLGIIATLAGQANYMTVANLKNVVARGHECVVHGSTTLTDLASQAAIETEIKVNRDFLINNGLAVNDSEKIYLYPQNVVRGAGTGGLVGNDGGELIRSALVNTGFIGARTTSVTGVLVDKYMGLGGRWCIPEIGHRAAIDTEANETANVDRVILRMQQAISLGRGVVITNHNIVADTPGVAPTSTIDIQVSNYARIVKAAYDLVSTGRAENVLLSTLVKRCIGSTN